MKEQQEKIRVLDPHIILILFISAFVFGIGILMIFLERKEIRTEGYEFIIFSVEILMLLLILYYMRTVVLSREGCTVSWLFSSLYEDKVMERITERNFEMMSGKYQKEQLEIEARLKEVTETLNESYEKSRGIRDFLALIRNYQGLKELDATVINALIDKILVSEREKMADGTVKQEIKIYYKFIGFVDELHIIPTKRWAAMPAKNCTVCGVEYVPGSGASRYCPACAKKIRREKSNESKRRSREQKRIACMNCPQKMTD